MNKKYLIFASASFHPNRDNLTFKKKDLLQREQDYLFCIKQLIRVAPENFDIYLVDNTIKDTKDLKNEELKAALSYINVFFSFDGIKQKIKNIGVGELKELFYLENIINFEDYEKVCYFSARRFITNPYVFERTIQLKKEALISNPDFVYLNGEVLVSEKKGMFNDMFFSMNSKTMLQYIEYSKKRIDYLEDKMINSETNLYDFITDFAISYEELKMLGFFRYDYYRNSKKLDSYKYHFI